MALRTWEASVGGSFRLGKRKCSTADRSAPSGPALLMRLPGGLIPFANGRDLPLSDDGRSSARTTAAVGGRSSGKASIFGGNCAHCCRWAPRWYRQRIASPSRGQPMKTTRLAGPIGSCALCVAAACGAGDAISRNGNAGKDSGALGAGASIPADGASGESDAEAFADSPEAGNDEATVDSGVQETAIALSLGGSTACALTSSGGVECWGSRLGSALKGTFSSVPEPVAGLESGVTAISVATFSACALTTCGAVECWGDNTSGLLGNDAVDGSSAVPEPVSGLADGLTAISVGSSFACAVARGGAQCWGSNYPSGGRGDNSVGSGSTVLPMPVVGLATGVTAIVVGDTSACALTESGAVQCWGPIAQVGTFVSVAAIPVPVTGLSSGVTTLSVGDRFACALSASGVQCWGDTPALGPFGFPTYPPGAVVGLSRGVKVIAAGLSSACVLTASGGIECWGDNSSGQLGNGSALSWSSVPVAVTGFASANKP